jgi:hypothetical protein
MKGTCPSRDVIVALTRTSFFQDPARRSLENCATWLVSGHRNLRLMQAVQNDWASIQERHVGCRASLGECADCLSALATACLWMSCAVGCSPLTDISAVADHLVASLPPALLTDPVLSDALAPSPQGMALLNEHGPAGLREQLAGLPGMGERHLGVPLLRPLVGRFGDPAWLSAANELLCDLDEAGAMLTMLADEIDARDDRYNTNAFLSAVKLDLGKVVWSRYAVIPTRQAIRTYLAAKSSLVGLTSTEEALRTVVAAPRRAASDTDAYAEATALSDEVWQLLLLACARPARGLPAVVNRERIVKHFGAMPSLATVELHPQLRRCIEGTVGTGNGVRRPRELEAFSYAQAFDRVLGFVDDRGHLPRSSDLPRDEVRQLESALGCTLFEFCTRMAARHGLRFSAQSRNEARVLDLVTTGFGQRLIGLDHEWSDPDFFGAAYRMDFRATIADEDAGTLRLFLEADGQGHFHDVDRWRGCDKTRDNDRSKAERSAQAGIPLVAIHHGCLSTGAKRAHLSPQDLTTMVGFLAEREDLVWMFVRPRGCDELRATPYGAEPQFVTIEGLEADVEVLCL